MIGVDAGGTKTLARAWRLTRGRGEEPEKYAAEVEVEGIDLPTLGEAECTRRLLALRSALELRLPTESEVAAAVLGLPGFGEVSKWTGSWHAAVQTSFGDWAPDLHNDVRLAFYAAFPDGRGVLVLSGTGSMAWGGDGQGSEARCGGWGHWFGDEGSAHEVGKMALRAAAAALDGRAEPTALSERIPHAFGVTDLWSALDVLFSDPRSSRPLVASLAALVDRLALEGDAVAQHCLREAAEDLSGHALTLIRRLDVSAMPVAFAGGAFRSSILRDHFNTCLVSGGGTPASPARLRPVDGALALARRKIYGRQTIQEGTR